MNEIITAAAREIMFSTGCFPHVNGKCGIHDLMLWYQDSPALCPDALYDAILVAGVIEPLLREKIAEDILAETGLELAAKIARERRIAVL